MLTNTLNNNFTGSISKTPGSRKILWPIFGFLTNFDDLLLYKYMKQDFGISIT